MQPDTEPDGLEPTTDSFEAAAPPVAFGTAQVSGLLTEALAPRLSTATSVQVDLAALLGQIGGANGLDAEVAAAALAALPAGALHALVQSVLAQLAELTQAYGLPLQADLLSLVATLNGEPATLLEGPTDAQVLWRALALSNTPLEVPAFVATGASVDAGLGLAPERAYRVLGTQLDGDGTRLVQLELFGRQGAEGEKEANTGLSVPFSALHRATLLALLGDPRIDIPYAGAADETRGPIDAACCQFVHGGRSAAPSTAPLEGHAGRLNTPRCKNCSYARQLCLPEAER
jgi:hypothetical protein